MSFKLTDFITVSNTGITTFGSDGILINRTGADAYLFFQKSGTNRGAIYGGDASDGNGLRFFIGNNSDPSLSIVSNGQVGIGTTSPDRELDIEKSTDNCIISAVSGTTRLAGLVMGDTADDDRGAILYNNNGDYLYFISNDSERMRITSGGNVGIGTTSPLTINGNASAGSGLHVNASSGYGVSVLDGADGSQMFFNDRGASVNSRLWRLLNNDGSFSINAMNDDISVKSSALTISSGGTAAFSSPNTTANVAMVTIRSTDSQGADVGGTLGLGGSYGDGLVNYALIRGAKETSTNNDSNGYMSFTVHSSAGEVERMRIASGGNVGIGVSPDTNSRLTIKGSGDSTTSNSIAVYNSTNASIFTVRDDGNVGIGTTTLDANANLTVFGNYRTDFIRDYYGGNRAYILRFGANTASSGHVIGSQIVASLASDDVNGSLEFYTKNAGNLENQLTISSVGNVGIGINPTAGYKLDVSGGDVRFGAGLKFASGSTLDAYEEGTFTVALLATTTNPTTTGQNTTGYYTRVGNVVTVQYYSSAISVSNAGAGFAYFAGFPYQSKNTVYHTLSITHVTCFANNVQNGYINSGTTDFYPVVENTINLANWKVGTGYIMIGGSYLI